MFVGQFFKVNPNFAILVTLTVILRDQVYFENNMVLDMVRELIMYECQIDRKQEFFCSFFSIFKSAQEVFIYLFIIVRNMHLYVEKPTHKVTKVLWKMLGGGAKTFQGLRDFLLLFQMFVPFF